MRHVINHKYLYLIILLFLILRIINLTAFPLFNDESIYLDWGFREVNKPGFLYYSLYDAKQPLLMWAFGLMENLLPDPVFAGRLVSVFAGFLTMLGIYKLTKYISNKNTALTASLLYVFVPLFSFYDRQALMEASIASVGVWSCYFLVKCIRENKYLNFIFLGIILGIGYFIKSTPIVYLFTSFTLLIISAFIKNKKKIIFEGLIISFTCFTASIILLIINPLFWQTLSSNTRFTLSISELLNFPFSVWISNLITNLRVSFFYITPIIFILSACGIVFIIKIKDKVQGIVALFFLISISIETLIIRGTIDRYLVAFLPLMLVFVSIFIISLIGKKKTYALGLFLITLSVLTSLPLTLLQVINQVDYFRYYGKISGISYYYYLDTFTTGYGLNEVFTYFDNISKDKKIIIGVGANTGNPESAMLVHYNKNPNVKTVYFDSRLLPPEINNYDCIDIGELTYFVSRRNELVGLDKFLINIKFVKDPYGKNIIGIYALKSNCKGKTTTLNLQEN